ncbi:FAS-associated factor 2-like [Hydractinia symbiolongicarpus]|uniref:FAS-associated factor 2-like n=1 Tax=Hydractinia symbiolongicarpus TaxID=13093 RepID=UPI00254AE733|nr:FAS-associated factor 2-like [Hydractinia symbiolongicarpus]
MAAAAVDDSAPNESGSQQEVLLQFQEIVPTYDEQQSQQILEKHQWNLEAAVQSAFNEHEGLPSAYDDIEHHDNPLDRPESSSSSHPTYSPGRSAVDVHRQNTWLNWLGSIAFFPLRVAHVGYCFCYHCFTEFLFFVVRIIWPNFGRALTKPVDDVIKFKEEYEELYGKTHPTFYLGSYSQVLNDAKKELKFLMVYLHSKDHQSTPEFCRTVLSNPGFREYINGNMLFWACDVNSNEGHRVSRAMRERTYPFLAIVCLRDNRMTVVWRIEGVLGVDEIIAVCAQAIDENEASLVAARAERRERSITQELRSEQDAAYLESLARDKQKEEEKKRLLEEARKEEELLRQKENEKLQKIQDLAMRREKCRDHFALLEEPTSSEDGALQIRIKLPNGRQLQRYFLKTNQLQLLYDFVLSHDDAPAEFLLNTNFPRKTFDIRDHESKTLQDVGIASSSAMFVQSLLDESSDEDE